VATVEDDLAAFERLASEAQALGVKDASTSVVRTGGVSKPAGRKPYVAYHSADGRLILVGRGGRDNDTLTTKFARPHDLWLHVKNTPGAHVVVPLEKNTSCPADLLVDAATLAVHHSDARDEQVAEVSYVERRHVRKRKGAAPGSVTMDREKVIVVRMERPRLERLLAAREE
jgi:predicted ribosome quality control (RQC) complex YloA/Tae2 family protein